MKDKKEKIAIIPGSFDPFTAGHLEIAERASAVFDRVVIAVLNNSEKKYLFSPEERVEIAKRSVAGIKNASVIYYEGYTAELYGKLGASALVKGVRNSRDLSYEKLQADYNAQRPEKCETVLLLASPGFKRISSTAVRKKLAENKDPGRMLVPAAAEYIGSIINDRERETK